MSTAPTATEVAQAGAQQAIDDMLIKILQETAVRQVLPKLVGTGVGAASVIGVAVAPAYAQGSTTPGAAVSVTGLGTPVSLQTGRLFLLKVPTFAPYPTGKPPKIYDEFEADAFSEKPLPLTGATEEKIGKVRMLGAVSVT